MLGPDETILSLADHIFLPYRDRMLDLDQERLPTSQKPSSKFVQKCVEMDLQKGHQRANLTVCCVFGGFLLTESFTYRTFAVDLV